MPAKITDKLATAPNHIILHINPIFEQLPIPIWRYDDPFLPFAKAIIPATTDLVAGYMFNLASYLSMAGAGAVALERGIALVPQNRIRILHGPFTGTAYSPMADATAFDVDAITVTHSSDYTYYSDHPPHTAILNSDTPQPGYNTLQLGSHQLHLNDTLYTLTTNDILYASKNDDFLDHIRQGIQSLL